MSAEAMARHRSDRVPSGSPKLLQSPSVWYVMKQAEQCRRNGFRAHLPPTISQRYRETKLAFWLQDDVGGKPLRIQLLHHPRDLRVVGIFRLKLHLHIA